MYFGVDRSPRSSKGGKSYDRSRCLEVPSERKAESKRRSLSIKDQAQEEAVVGHVPSLK
jgi:hypothetical protein